MSTLLERIDGGVLVLDGGTGSELLARGMVPGEGTAAGACCERLLLEDPGRVRAVHEGFLAAGCDALRTCSFGGDERSLARHGLGGRAREVGRAAARVAMEAIERAERRDEPRFVLGCAGPGFDLPSRDEASAEELRAAYEPLFLGLAEGGADALLVETARDPAQARAALQAARAAERRTGRGLPVFVSFSPDAYGALAGGIPLAPALDEFAALDVELLALNCGTGPADMEASLEALARSKAPRIGCWPNAGLPRIESGRALHPVTPAELAAFLRRAVLERGARIVGGCCGATPAHVAELARTLRGLAPGPRAASRRA